MLKKPENCDYVEQKLSDGSIKKYIRGRLLGKGGFAKCYQFLSLQTQKKYAAKLIEKQTLQKSRAKQKLISQIKIHKSIHHPYIVHFQHYFEDSEFVYILLEKCSNQTLNQLLKRRKRLTQIQVKYYVRQLALAIKYLHDQLIIHRDLKLGNLFLSEKLEIKIGDFGLATKLNHITDRRKTKCGTPNYIAPEILDDKKSHSLEVDVWSMGVITYTLLVGRPPFETNDVKTTYSKIKTCNYSFPDSANVSQSAKTFISKMLQLDPSKRATISEILQDSFLHETSIPPSLPISSLACPPSFDFLKKYKEAEDSLVGNYKTANESLSKNEQEQLKFSNSNCFSQQKIAKKNTSKIISIQKCLKSTQRVFSAANLTTDKPIKITKKKNELQNKSLKIWVEYYQENAKYGLAYLLNTGSIGFKYNDKSVLISNSKLTQLKYLDYDPNIKNLSQTPQIMTHKQAQQLQTKKHKILLHFHRQLIKQKQQKQNKMDTNLRLKIQSMKNKQTPDLNLKTYIIRYHKTNKSIIFWFNNKSLQIIFQDGSQLLVNQVNSNNIITFINKYKHITYFEQKNKHLQTDQIKKRLAYLHYCTESLLVKKNDHENQNTKQPQIKSTAISRNNSMKFKNCDLPGRILKSSSSTSNILGKSKKINF